MGKKHLVFYAKVKLKVDIDPLIFRWKVDREQDLDGTAPNTEEKALSCLDLSFEVFSWDVWRKVQKVTVIKASKEFAGFRFGEFKRTVTVDDVSSNGFILGVDGLQLAFDVLLRVIVLFEALLWVAFFVSDRAITFYKLKMVHTEDNFSNNLHMALHDGRFFPVVKNWKGLITIRRILPCLEVRLWMEEVLRKRVCEVGVKLCSSLYLRVNRIVLRVSIYEGK